MLLSDNLNSKIKLKDKSQIGDSCLVRGHYVLIGQCFSFLCAESPLIPLQINPFNADTLLLLNRPDGNTMKLSLFAPVTVPIEERYHKLNMRHISSSYFLVMSPIEYLTSYTFGIIIDLQGPVNECFMAHNKFCSHIFSLFEVKNRASKHTRYFSLIIPYHTIS